MTFGTNVLKQALARLRASATLSIALMACPMAQTPTEQDVFMVGHSLVNFTMPHMLKSLVAASGGAGAVDVQVTNGASILANWENPNSAQGTPYTTALPTGKYEALVLTEAVPLLNHTTWSNTYQAASQFLGYARGYRSDIRFYIYETWHCINTGRTDTVIAAIAPRTCWYDNDDGLLWQPRLVADHPKWVKILDSAATLQNRHPSSYLIPAGSAFSQLALEIQAGRVPGLASFRELFEDDIHPNRLGNWFVANVIFATLRGRSPVGLAHLVNDEYGNRLLEIPQAQATKLQQVAWEAVCAEPRSGVSCATTGIGSSHDRNWSSPLRPTRLFDAQGRLVRNPQTLVRRLHLPD